MKEYRLKPNTWQVKSACLKANLSAFVLAQPQNSAESKRPYPCTGGSRVGRPKTPRGTPNQYAKLSFSLSILIGFQPGNGQVDCIAQSVRFDPAPGTTPWSSARLPNKADVSSGKAGGCMCAVKKWTPACDEPEILSLNSTGSSTNVTRSYPISESDR